VTANGSNPLEKAAKVVGTKDGLCIFQMDYIDEATGFSLKKKV
jgi:hypothetical protein